MWPALARLLVDGHVDPGTGDRPRSGITARVGSDRADRMHVGKAPAASPGGLGRVLGSPGFAGAATPMRRARGPQNRRSRAPPAVCGNGRGSRPSGEAPGSGVCNHDPAPHLVQRQILIQPFPSPGFVCNLQVPPFLASFSSADANEEL